MNSRGDSELGPSRPTPSALLGFGTLRERNDCAKLCKGGWKLWRQWNRWNTEISNLRVFNSLNGFNSPASTAKQLKINGLQEIDAPCSRNLPSEKPNEIWLCVKVAKRNSLGHHYHAGDIVGCPNIGDNTHHARFTAPGSICSPSDGIRPGPFAACGSLINDDGVLCVRMRPKIAPAEPLSTRSRQRHLALSPEIERDRPGEPRTEHRADARE